MSGQGTATIDQAFDSEGVCRYLSRFSPLAQVAVEGASHIVRYLNPAFARLVGKPRSELIGRSYAEAMPDGPGAGCLSLFDRVYRTGTAESLVEEEHHRGSPRFRSYTVWAILGPDKKPAGLMIQVTDSTETALTRKRATEINESLLLSAIRQHELVEVAENLNTQLQAAIHHKDRFMAILSHELRTPLNPVVAALSLLRRDTRLDEDTRGALEIIDRNVALEVRLIDDLLDMTRIEQGKMNLKREPIDLRMVVDHAVEVCGLDLEARRITLGVDRDERPCVVDADAGRLQQVFWNLLRNAIKFSPDGGDIRVRCRRQGDSSVVAEVSDGGIGIDPKLLPRLFNAFQQGDGDQVRRYGGLGLGLAISKTIVELHGGTITAHSRGTGQGSRFSVVLPIMPDAAANTPADAVEPGGSGTPEPVNPKRILLVEDHSDSAWAMSRLLRSNGHEVQWAPDITTALKLATEQPFDLLISDLGLPDGSGLDLIRVLRERGATLPAIALSGYGQEQDILQSTEAGFTLHLTKPAMHNVLQTAILSLAETSAD